MKYDLLIPFKEQLENDLPANTAKTYYAAIVKLFRNQQFNSFQELEADFFEKAIPTLFKSKNEFSAAKNSLLRLKKLYPDVKVPDEGFFQEVSATKRNRRRKPTKIIDLDRVKRTVNQISNPKLKYAYRLAMISGLRVAELSRLEAPDFEFVDGNIIVNVKHGKGGSNGQIMCINDPYLYEKLQDYINNHEGDSNPLFYSESHMRNEANRLNLECHDFRRIFAQTLRNQLKNEGKENSEINRTVKSQLRHKRFSTTKRYLYNRKLVIK